MTVTGEGEILSGTVSARENPANAEAGNTETNITNTSYEKMTREKEQIINTRMEDYLNAIASKKSTSQTVTGISAPITAHGILSIKTLLPLMRKTSKSNIW